MYITGSIESRGVVNSGEEAREAKEAEAALNDPKVRF